MKKFIIFFLLISFVQALLGSYSLKPITTLTVCDSMQSMQEDTSCDGVNSGTLVKVTSGYIPIEQIHVGDVIEGIDGEQEVIAIKKVWQSDEVRYQLTTEHHGFYIYPYEFVHNMDVACISSAGTLCFGVLEFCNPVTLLLGALVPLTVYAVDYYQSKKQLSQSGEFQKVLQDSDLVRAVRLYYETKRKELVEMHQELLQLKNNLSTMLKSRYKDIATFSSVLLSAYSYKAYKISLLPNLSVEIGYAPSQKEQLLHIRDQELKGLQEEILEIEMMLGLHVDELVQQCGTLYGELQEHIKIVQESVVLWNHHINNLWYELVIKGYEASFEQEFLSTLLEQKIKELEFVASYYNRVSSTIFKKTSNLYQVLSDQLSMNNKRLQNLIESNKNLYHWRQLDEKYLRDIGALTFELVSDIKIRAKCRIIEYEKTALLQVKKKKQSMQEYQQELLSQQPIVVSAGGAPDPDDEEWRKKHPHGRYEENPKHHQNSRGDISKPPRDGQAALDNSISVPGKACRVSIQDNQIIIFQQHEIGKYHGYIVENFHSLDSQVQRALRLAGRVINPKTGKIK